MASLSPDTCPDPFKRKKRRSTTDEKTASSSSSRQDQRNKRIKRWRTQREQQIYSSKLVQALRRSRRSSAISVAKEVRQTADTVLAVLAKGTTRWSRAIIASRATTTTTKHKKAKIAVSANTRPRKMREIIKTEKRKAPAVERKLKVLGRLIPGGQKLTFSNLLEETSDYIAALEMQVRAMTAITELLAGGAGPQPPADRIDSNVNS